MSSEEKIEVLVPGMAITGKADASVNVGMMYFEMGPNSVEAMKHRYAVPARQETARAAIGALSILALAILQPVLGLAPPIVIAAIAAIGGIWGIKEITKAIEKKRGADE